MASPIQLGAVGLALAVLLPALAEAEPRPGQVAPRFALLDENGVRHTLEQQRGKIVVLEWTNPGCPFVQRHYKKRTMLETARAFEGKIVWLAVNSTHFAKPEETRRWRAQHRLPYPTLQDPDGAVGRAYGARTTPQIFVIDATGVLRYAGAIDNDPHEDEKRPVNYARAALDALLAGKAPSPAETQPYGCSVKYKR
jgi:peroxiredoxin